MVSFKIADWPLLEFVREPRTLLFSLLGLLLGAGFSWGVSASNALFISRVGTESLFQVYLGSSLMTLGMSGLFYFLADRYARERLFFWSFELFGVAILLGWWLLRSEPTGPAVFFWIRIFFYAVFIVTNFEYWMLAGHYFTNFEARLRYPLLVAANVLGIMLGGLALDLFAARLGTINFFLLWGVLIILAPALLRPLEKKTNPQFGLPVPAAAGRPEGQPSTRLLFILLFLFWLAYTFIGYGVDYLFNKISLQHFQDEDRLAAFFGAVAFYSLLAVIAYQLLAARFIASFLSVERAVLVISLLFVLGAVGLAMSSSLLSITLVEGLFFYFIDFAAMALLLPVNQVFPEHMKAKAAIGIEGFGRPVGSLALFLTAQALALALGLHHLVYILVGATLLFLVYPLVFRPMYLYYLLKCLKSPDPNLVRNAVQALGEPDKARATDALLHLLASRPNPALQREIVLAFGRMRSPKALSVVIQLFSTPHEWLQLAVLESLALYKNYDSLFALYQAMNSQENVSFQVRMNATWLMTKLVGKRMLSLLRQALENNDPRIQANAIESLALLKDPGSIPLLLPYLNHAHRRVRANAAVALDAFRETRDQARAAIRELYGSEDPLSNFAAIYAIGELGLRCYERELKERLKNPDPVVQLQLSTALAKMGLPQFCQKFADFLSDAEESTAFQAISSLHRFPKLPRRLVFENISRRPIQERTKILLRMDKTPFDFSKEKALLLSSQDVLIGPRII